MSSNATVTEEFYLRINAIEKDHENDINVYASDFRGISGMPTITTKESAPVSTSQLQSLYLFQTADHR